MTKPWRVGVAGAGEHARRRVLSLQALEDVEVVALADIDHELAQELGRDLGVPAVFPTVRALLRSEGLDGLVVATRQDEQIHDATHALRGRIPVLCEKPLGQARCSVSHGR